jgi:hypothetical protein
MKTLGVHDPLLLRLITLITSSCGRSVIKTPESRQIILACEGERVS